MVRVAGRRVSTRFNAVMWGRVGNDFMLLKREADFEMMK
jgi:hypothetical protein